MPTLLVVDDDRAVLQMLLDLLGAAGYETLAARDGHEALATLTATPVPCDAVLLDVLIPRGNGFTVVEELRTHRALRELPVIMMSGIYRSRKHRAEMTTRFGVIDYLDKPLDTAALLDLLGRVVGPPSRAPARPPSPVTTPLDAASARDRELIDRGADEERSHVEAAARVAFEAPAFALQGTLEAQPVPALLGRLWRQRQTGALLLRRAASKKIVFVRDGGPVAVRSNLVSECLGRLLVRERLISEADCAASIERLREGGQKQGEILVQMRCISQKNLDFALERQNEQKLFDTFTWPDGEFRFNAAAQLPSGQSFEAPTPALVLEGIRHSFDEARARHWMLPLFDVALRLRATPEDEDALRLREAERACVLALATPQSPRALLAAVPLAASDTLRLLYALVALELCVPAA